LEANVNPLSPFTYTLRHKRQALLMVAFLGLVTAGLYLMVALTWAIFVEPTRSNRLFLSKFSIVVIPSSGNELDPTTVAQIRAHPDVERVLPAVYGLGISLPEVIGSETSWFNLIGLREEDISYVLKKCGATLKEGHLPQPRTWSILLSKQVAASLDLQVGDVIHNAVDPKLYTNIVDPLQVVGILEGDVRLGIISQEYLASHELYRAFPVRFLVVAQEGREAAVDNFLRREIQTSHTEVLTFTKLAEQMTQEYWASALLFLPIITLVAIAVTLVIGAVNRITFAQRLTEFGLLHATGHSKAHLTRRLTLETTLLAVTGWVVGIGLSWLALCILRSTVFEPRGHDLAVVTWTPAWLVLPVPITLIGFTRLSFGRVFGRLDAVAVVEQGELSLEENRRQATVTSSPRPLTSRTFYSRHKQRAILLTSTMVLMIAAVALTIFIFAASDDARQTHLENLSRMSSVSARLGSYLHPSVAARLRTHPTVERAIPFLQFTLLDVTIPPFGSATINPYAVYADDMAYLVALYNLELADGHLPRPNTNEVVIPQAVAQNRQLEVGDVLGNPDRPAYPGAMKLPTEFVISGIFARPTAPGEENWLAFVSLEFLESHEAYGNIGQAGLVHLITVPKAGQKAAMDDWLENELDSGEVQVLTYRQWAASAKEETLSMMLTIALIESGLAVMAAVALAVLNYIFVSQRQPEFGVLHALGYGRWQLIWRTVREAAFTIGTAWGLSALLCLGLLLYMQFGMFTPLGLRLNFFNVTPWLFTLPIPITVLAAVTSTVAWTLSRLDPVAIIERR
jgi:ABC-type lipoprotein release transport system permease subunit